MHYSSDWIDRLHVKSIHCPQAFIADDWCSARRYDSACIQFLSLTGRKMAASRDNPRFQLLSEQELNDLMDGTDAKSTKRTLKFGWSKLESFAQYTNTDLENIGIESLDNFLSSFYAAVRKEDGSSLTKRSMQAIHYAVQWHFLDERGFDICEKAKFPKSNKVFRAVLVKLKTQARNFFFWYIWRKSKHLINWIVLLQKDYKTKCLWISWPFFVTEVMKTSVQWNRLTSWFRLMKMVFGTYQKEMT